jgi:diacylglycerol kinase (ATP)
MMILLNPLAGGGKASDRWRRLAATLPPFHEDVDVQLLTPGLDIAGVLEETLSHHNGHFLAAGGDGTVNVTLNAIMQLPETSRRRVILGAIGLGSSNDFHKPFSPATMIQGLPARMNFDRPVRRDVGQASLSLNGWTTTHYFIINSSIGITAEGNVIFNSPGPLLRFLKTYSTPAAILYAAMTALVRHKNQRFTLGTDGWPEMHVNLTNLGVVKNPHLSGTLHYGTPAHYDDGMFGIHMAEEMGYTERLRLLQALSHGRFDGTQKTFSTVAPGLTVSSSSAFAVELDGEIRTADHVEFSVVSQAIQVCS